MALKILNTIGCDMGITSEAYVRINNYNIDKVNGYINISYSTYFNEDNSKNTTLNNIMPIGMINGIPIKNIKIGDSMTIPIKKEITQKITTYQLEPIKKEVTREIDTTIDGVTTTGKTTSIETVMEEVPVVNESKISVPDMSILENVNVFQFCYEKLKEKLLLVFDNIIDC